MVVQKRRRGPAPTAQSPPRIPPPPASAGCKVSGGWNRRSGGCLPWRESAGLVFRRLGARSPGRQRELRETERTVGKARKCWFPLVVRWCEGLKSLPLR